MKLGLYALAIIGFAASANAQNKAGLTTEQAAILYDQCLARAAAKASRTDAADEDVYGLAKTACAPTRLSLVAGYEPSSERVQTLDSIDEERAATFPERTRKLREMLRKYQPQAGTSN